MNSSLNIDQMKTVLGKINENKDQLKFFSDFFNIKSQIKPNKTKTVKFCVTPKVVSQSIVDSNKNFQKEYNLVLSRGIQYFDLVKEYFQAFVSENLMIQRMFELDRKVTQYKNEKKQIYSEIDQIHGIILRNDFMFDCIQKQIYQIEINLISVSMHSFAQNLQRMLRCLYSELDSNQVFASKP